ncbi:MAG TPA: DUF202 domain-containing protein [Pseudonocardia sp.]
MSTIARKDPDDGLQAERTALAWSRTSFGVLGNGVLLLLRDLHHDSGPMGLAPAGLAVVVALLTYLIGRRRQRLLRSRPLPRLIGAGREIHLIGISVIALTVVTALALPT